MSDTSKCSGRSTKSTSVQMQGLLNEFKLLYQNRLKKLELQEPHNEETIKIKIKTLESYVKDLLEQNDVLIQTIDELEKEANSRVAKLEVKLTKSANSFKDLSYKYKDLEKDLKSLNGRNETLERELKNKADNAHLLEREMSRLKASYEEAVKTLASKTRGDDSILLNMSTYQNEAHLKNLEDSLSTAVKSKNELCYELKEQDKRIVSLQHHNSELQHLLFEKDEEIRCLEEDLKYKVDSLKKLQFPSQNECKLHRDFMQVELEKEDMKLKLANLNHDISCLLSAFNAAKNSGKFELKNVFLKEISAERLRGLMADEIGGTGSSPASGGGKRVHFADLNASTSHELLKAELHHSQEIITSLKQELNSLRNQYEALLNGKEIALSTIKSTLTSAHNKEIVSSGQIFEKDMEIRRLKNDLNELKSHLDVAKEDAEFKKTEVKECKLELTDLVNEVKSLRSEMICKEQQIYALKEKLHQQSLEMTCAYKTSRESSPYKRMSVDESGQYEKRIQELKASLDDAHREKYKLIDELNAQKNKFKACTGSPQGLESLRFELKTRDDIIQKLRQEVLLLQEKRDQIYGELDAQSAKFSQVECRLFFKEEENGHLTNRFRQSQKEAQDWKKSYEEEHLRNEQNVAKFSMYDEQIASMKEKVEEAQAQNQRLTVSLQKLQSGSKETRDKLSEELCKRQDEVMNLQREKCEKSSYETCIQAELKEKTNLIHKLHADLDSRNLRLETQLDKLTQYSQEIAQLKKKCDDQERDLKDCHAKLNENVQGSEVHLNSLTGQLLEREDQLARSSEESARRLTVIEQLEREIGALEARHDAAVKEIGRLESRVQSHQMDFKNETKIMEIEMQKRDEKYFQLRQEKEACGGQVIALEDKLKDYELVISSLKQQNLSYQCSFKSKEDQVRSLEAQVEDLRTRFQRASDELVRLEEKNNAKLSDLSSIGEVKRELEHKLSDKNHLISQLREQNKVYEDTTDDLRQKLLQKEDTLQKLSVEIDRLNCLSQSKTKECHQKAELTQSLDASLQRTEVELLQLRQTLEKERSKYESALQKLDTELDHAKSITLSLSDQLKDSKLELETFKKENFNLTSKLQNASEDKNSLSDRNQQLERQLVTSQEKNKFCQSEVAQRDQTIIGLKSEMSVLTEKHSSQGQELKIQEEEINRLNTRIKSQGNELKQLQSMNDHMEVKQADMDQALKQRDYEVEACRQELARQDKQMENIRSEWASGVRNYEEEIRGYKQNFQILNEELAHTKADLGEFMVRINSLKEQVCELNAGLAKKGEENAGLTGSVKKYEGICKEQEERIRSCLQELGISRGDNEKAKGEIEGLMRRLGDVEQKEEASYRQVLKGEENVRQLQEAVIEWKFKFAEKEQALEAARNEVNSLSKLVGEKNSELKKVMERCQSLGEDLDKMGFDLAKMESSYHESERQGGINFAKLTEKIEDFNEMEKKFIKAQNDLKSYQAKYTYTAEEIMSRENRATQLEYDLEENMNQLQLLKNQQVELLKANASAKTDYESLLDLKRNTDKENMRLDANISEIQMNFTSSCQQLKAEIGRLEAHIANLNSQLESGEKQIGSLTDQISQRDENCRKLENQLGNVSRELMAKVDEVERLNANIQIVREANGELERVGRERESILNCEIGEKEHMRKEVNGARHQLQCCLNEKAHVEERFMLLSRNAEQMQEEIRVKVTENVRLEQASQKQATELRTIKERNRSYEEEINELKGFGEKLKKDLFTAKEEAIGVGQEASRLKSALIKCQHELETSREQEKIVTEQLVANDNVLQQVHGDLRNERTKLQESQRFISQLKQQLVDTTNEKENNERQVKEQVNRIKERETKLQSCQTELDTCQQSLRTLKEEMAEKDGRLKVLKMELESSEKQRLHFIDEIQKYEEAVDQFKRVIENSQIKFRACHSDLLQSQQHVADLKTALASGECSNKETLSILAEKSKENTSLKNDCGQLKKANESLVTQMGQLTEKFEVLRTELKKTQDDLVQVQYKAKGYEQEGYDVRQQLQACMEKCRTLGSEVCGKEEALVSARVEVQGLVEKLRFKGEEVEKLRGDANGLVEEQKRLEVALEKSRENGERLHKESEMVIANVNSWVSEQRNNSEKLAMKIREQATAIVYLKAEKERLIGEVESLQSCVKRLGGEVENAAYDKEKVKALQNHLGQQQALLQQVQTKVKEYEARIAVEGSEGCRAVEELHNRLRHNVESMQILNCQVNALQRENMGMKECLEKERAARQTLQLQLESKNQFIQSFTQSSSSSGSPGHKKGLTVGYGQPKLKQGKNNMRDSPDDVGYLSSPSRSSSHQRAPLRDKNNCSDFDTDSDYWRHKAGELSVQLEHTKRFLSCSRVDK